MDFVNLLQFKSIFLIQFLFLINFIAVFLLSYPLGRLVIGEKSKEIFFCSIISNSIFAVLIAIFLNINAYFAKYFIIVFFILNFLIISINKKIYKDFLSQIIKNKFIFLALSIIYIFYLILFIPIEINRTEVIIPYDRHFIYYFSPIQEILSADYFSRIKVTSLFPMEWATFYFFQASFNSIYLHVLTNFGFLSLIFLKAFFFGLFLSNLIFFIIKKINLSKDNYNNLISFFFLFNFFYYLFFSSTLRWSFFGNEAIVIFALYFLFINFFEKKNHNFFLPSALLIIGSFKSTILSVIYFIYEVTKKKIYFNWRFIFKKEFCIFLFIVLYLLITFTTSTNVIGRFNVPGTLPLWDGTFSYKLINNKIILFLFLITLLTMLIFFQKKFFLYNIKTINNKSLILIFLILFIPLVSLIGIGFKNIFIDYTNSTNFKIFLNSLSFQNLNFYFLVPILWFFLLSFTNNLIKLFFIFLITIYTFLSIFIHSHIILPAIYILEIFFILYLLYFFIIQKKNLFIKIKIIIIISFINISSLNFNNLTNYKYLTLKINELRILTVKEYICPEDINNFRDFDNVVESDLLSGLLNKRFYTSLSRDKNFNWYNHMELAVQMVIPLKNQFISPCDNK